MASLYGSGGFSSGEGGLLSRGGGGTTDVRSSNQTYMSQPGITDPLAASLASLQQGLAGQYQGLLSNPTASPLFQAQLGPLLQSLVPSENLARQNLSDTFRQAGGLRSGAYGNSASQLEGNILGNRQTEAGKLLGQAFPQLIQALQNPLGQVSSLIDALKLSQAQGAAQGTGSSSSGWENIPPSLGLNTPMQSDKPSPYTQPTMSSSGGGMYGSTYPPSSYGAAAPANSNTGAYDLLSRVLGGGSGTTFNPVSGFYESAPASNLGTFGPTQGGPSYPAPTPEYNSTTGAYQGGYNEGDYSSWAQAPTGWTY